MDTKDDNYVTVETPKLDARSEDPIVASVVADKNDADGKAMSTPLASFTELFQFADSTDKILMAVGSLAAIITGVAQPIQITFFGDLINAFNPSGGGPLGADFQKSINHVVYQFLVVACIILFCGFLQIACWSIAASRQAKRLRNEYARAILRQEIGWFDVHDPMQLATRVADTTLLVQEGMGRKVGDGVNFLAMGLAAVVIAFYYGWELSLVLFAFTPLLAISAFCMTKTITAAVQGGVEAYAEAGGIAEESLSNIKTVHMFNAMEAMADKYMSALMKTQKAGVKKGLAVGIGTGMTFFILLCTYAVGMYYGAVRITNDQLGDKRCTGGNCYDGGRVIIVFTTIVIGAMALGQAGPSIQALTTARSAAYDIFQLIHRQSQIDASSTEGKTLDHVEGHIALESIRFAYPSRPNVEVAAGYSLSIPAGQKIALVGSSGCGKSTIVSLLERFYDPLEGRVTLDGHDLKDLNVKWLRDQIGLVGQEPTLFSNTIAENIRHGRPSATIEEVYEAAKQANAYDFIMGFPMGFDTEVGDRGAQLSGGQKQRIAIARAIIKNPAVLLLDEATSALDTESEHVVQASLDRLLASRQRTTVIIAHRLSTIRDADRIVVLSHGNVIEDGNHESLLKIENGHYKALVAAQTRGKEEGAKEVVTEQVEMIRKASTSMSAKGEEVMSETNCENSDDASIPDVPLSRVWALSRPDTKHLIFGSIGALFHGGLYPIWGVLLTKCTVVFFKLDLGSHAMRTEALNWSMGFLALGAAILIALTVQNHQFALVCERLTSRIRGLCFRSMLRQDIAWFDDRKNSSGALTTRLATDSAAIRSMTAETLNAILINIATLVVAFSIAFYYSWRMTLIVLAVLPIMTAAQMLQMKMMTSQTGKDINDGDIKAGALLSEAINAIRTVASFNLEGPTTSAYFENLQASSSTDRKAGIGGGIAYSVSQSSMIFALSGIFYYGGWLMTHGLLDFQSMFMVLNAVMFCSFGVGIAAQGMGDVGKAKKSVKSIFAIIDRQPPIDCTADDGIKLSHVSGDVELRGLDFCYPSRPDSKIYSNYNLKIKSGQTVALVGGSGSGKSTAINLIERFYDPNAGAVYLDGVDLKSINVQSLRNHISIVSQEPVLFVGTIGENIATGKPGATQAEIEDAAKKANAHDFIMQFPDGYNTSVGDRGVQVSGGQKQRIAIARAIIRDPEILLLDEATSALDNESERIVQASLDALLQIKSRTTIIVAHRLSTIRNADVIAVTDGGRIAELGTHNELIAIPNGIYANLVARQMQ
ncbi:unnamed protein product [Aphanomyces euteiches]|uniref:Uncharacterized protein n=1 Tax=Aphanomyces euteiches TaxID=100861 RepID=A0A6G0WGS2_9STRA|nr:hypothetical protein Ae201684_015371 [Aphanomyces euteiches]KAH9097604.1 hypothetical protein Ae201684P_001080 [Aphanomyces euteiches]